jgi:hypothetical protein
MKNIKEKIDKDNFDKLPFHAHHWIINKLDSKKIKKNRILHRRYYKQISRLNE